MKNAIVRAGLLMGVLAFSMSPALSRADEDPTGVEGLAALYGDFVPGAVVLAFGVPGPGPGDVPLAVSGPTDQDGRYRLPLAPGKYFLVAVKTARDPWPPPFAPEDLFCYYLGNPVVVEQGRLSRVGFNMIPVPQEAGSVKGTRSGIRGRVIFEEEPLGRAYLYVYRDTTTNLRGMGIAAMPSNPKGEFKIKLPPGRYYILARKREAGGIYGPPKKNDHIGYYFGNPVEVVPGEFKKITLETTTRVDLLEETWFKEGKGAGWFQGLVVDPEGGPVAGLYVLFYSGPETAGSPAFVAGPTDQKGRFKVRAALGKFRLLARAALGGPPEPGEWYGRYRDPGGGEEVEAVSGKEIRITVSPYRAP